MKERTITMSEIATCNTWSVKDDSPRGCKSVSSSQIKPGDKVVYNNYFTLVIDDPADEQPTEEQNTTTAPETATPATEPTENATEEQPTKEPTTTAYTITRNAEYNSVEISFNEKPAAEIRDALKALKFRWNSVKKIWYGYADPDTIRAVLNGTNAKTATPAPAAPLKKATPQDHIKIYWNGIKIDGGKLIKCYYSINNSTKYSVDCITISARNYDDLPRDLLPVRNETDVYTDYFDNDRATITAEHPLYKYFLCAFKKCERRNAEKRIKNYEKHIKTGHPSLRDYYEKELIKARADFESLQNIDDPGQPTQEDLEQIDKARQEAENKRREEEHKRQLEERERVLIARCNGRRLIDAEQKAHPINPGDPVVLINWSEHPAFYDYEDDSLTLSLTAANNILRKLDIEQHETRETESGRGGLWYYKTKFTITGKDENGEDFSYTGRYDLGDDDGGLIEHIRAIAEWYRTHDAFGHIKETPDETNDTLQFVEYLEQFIEEDRTGKIISMF